MKVLIVVEAAGGVRRHLVDLIPRLQSYGVTVGICYSSIRADPEMIEFVDWFASIGGFVRRVDMSRSPSIGDVSAIIQVKAVAKEFGATIIHGHSSKGGAVARIVGHQLKIPVAYTPHGYVTLSPGLSRSKRIIFGYVERVLSNVQGVTIAVSNIEKYHGVNCIGVDKDRITVVNNGVTEFPTEDRDVVQEKFGIDPNRYNLGWVGRMCEQKRPDRFVRVMSMVPNAHAVMVGDGELLEATKALALKLGVNNRIDFLGFVNGREIMPAFDRFVLTSDYEGYPYVILEAMYAGVPANSTDMGSVSDVIEGVVNCSVTAIGDEVGMAAQLKNPPTKERPTPKIDIGVEAMVEKTVAVYRQLAPV